MIARKRPVPTKSCDNCKFWVQDMQELPIIGSCIEGPIKFGLQMRVRDGRIETAVGRAEDTLANYRCVAHQFRKRVVVAGPDGKRVERE